MHNPEKYKKWYGENKEKKKDVVRRRVNELRKNNLCITCGRQLTSGIASSRCFLCYERNASNAAIYRFLKPIE